ncbi:MAG: hypothetical protein HY904_24525 [Deltaproteobacteria bacterium]|nr:hypothetical protein [Deltaproteobacteria bacterium]
MTTLEEGLSALDRDALRELVRHALRVTAALPAAGPLPDAVTAGTVALVPREEGLQPKDLPVETLLHKITMVRDKLRVAEQRVNASDGLTPAARQQLQGRLTEAYRALAAVDALLSPPPAGNPGGTP